MNRHQSRKSLTYTARRLPVTELRPGMHVTLAKHSPTSRILPEKVGQCVGGSYAVVTECQNFGDDLRVRVSHSAEPGQPPRVLTFVAPANQRVIARVPEAAPVPFTPLGWAVMLGIPGAAEMAKGTSYAAA